MATTSDSRPKPGAPSRPDSETTPKASQANADPGHTPVNQIQSQKLSRSDSAESRHARISEAAYHRASKRGFVPGGEWEDWFEAEREIDGLP